MALSLGGETPNSRDTVTSTANFEAMLDDLKGSFYPWLKLNTNHSRKLSELHERRSHLLKQETQRTWDEHLAFKHAADSKLQDDRKKGEAELQMQVKMINVEMDDARAKLTEAKALYEAEKETRKRILRLEKAKFESEQAAQQKQKHKVMDLNIAAETKVELNVGGTVFQTSRHTLLQQPGSFLEALMVGRVPAERDRNGNIFIDKDSQNFRLILNYLRNPTRPPLPLDSTSSNSLATDSAFFGIKFFPFPLVFACGGHNGTEPLRSLELLDVENQTWRRLVSMETERSYFGSESLLNRLFVFGGQNLDYKALCDVEIFDCLRNVWIGGSSLIHPRRNLGSTLLDGRIYAIGGFDGHNIMTSVEMLDPRMSSWIEMSSLRTPRSSPMAVVADNKVYVLGGTRGERMGSVEVYEPRMDRWTPGLDMIEVRSGGTGCSIGGTIYAIGGADNSHRIHNSCEAFDVDTQKWTFIKPMLESRMDCGAVAISNSIMVCGGQGESISRTTEFFRAELNEWQYGPCMNEARNGHSVLVTSI